MLILIVDDQYEGKAKTLARVANRTEGAEVSHVPNAREAIKLMKTTSVDILFVDIQIPFELGEDVELEGGKKLLEYIEVNDEITKPKKVVAVTSHMDSYERCRDFFSSRGWGLFLNPDEEQIETLLAAQMMGGVEKRFSYDIAVITALEHTELEAVLKLPYSWVEMSFPDDITSYYEGHVHLSDGSKKSIIACSAPRMGMAAAAVMATKVIIKFSPKILAMTGIAAAVEGEAKLGDILIADPSWDWGSGKLTVRDGCQEFLSDPAQVALDPRVSSKIRTLSVSRKYLDEIYANFKGRRPSHDLSVRLGPVASGAVVLEDPDTVRLIRSQHRKTVGIEMEAYGFMSAAFYMGSNKTVSLVIKSVCDFADPEKNNEWQEYAAYTSASYLDRLLVNEMFNN